MTMSFFYFSQRRKVLHNIFQMPQKCGLLSILANCQKPKALVINTSPFLHHLRSCHRHLMMLVAFFSSAAD